MPMYGIARSGAHQGELTRCKAKDPNVCPYHTEGSHKNLSEESVARFNEKIIAAESQPKPLSRTSMIDKDRTSTTTNEDRESFSQRLKGRFRRKGSFLQRSPANGERHHRMRKMVASALMISAVMGMSACGNSNSYDEPTSPSYSESQEATPDSSKSSGGSSSSGGLTDITGKDLVDGAEKGIDKAKQKAKEFKDSGQYDELKDKAKDYYGKAKDYVQSGQASDKAKEWYGKAKEYVDSGSASSDLQSLIDSLSSYGVGGSTGDVNASSGDSTGVYANVSKDQALDELASLRIEPGNERGYDRGKWRHWIATSEAPGGGGLGRKGCFDVREQVLARQGQNVRLVDNGCEVQATLNDPYTGTNGHTRKDMQIDHSVPLGYAYAHGGRNWSAQQKQNYANDLTQGQLVAALGSENVAKSDKGPSEWLPDKDQCGYAKNFAHVLYRWDLSTTQSDHDMMDKIIRQCAA